MPSWIKGDNIGGSLDPSNIFRHFPYRRHIDILRFTEKHGDKITMGVVFNQVGVSLGGPQFMYLLDWSGNCSSRPPKNMV